MMDKLKAAAQFRRALQLFAASLDEGRALEIAGVYPAWEAGRAYAVGEYLAYGVNGVGDPQLYKVAQAHTSQEDWRPDALPALYTPVGLTADGYRNEISGHAIVVLEKTDEYVKVTESGGNNKALWGGQYPRWWLEQQPGYTLNTRYPE